MDIKKLLRSTGETQAWVAEQLGYSTSYFNQKLKKGNLSDDDLKKIADLFDGTYEKSLTIDGKKVDFTEGE